MSDGLVSAVSLWPLRVNYQLVGDQDTEAVIQIGPGLSTLVGPNGSGKTRALRAIKSTLTAPGRTNADSRKVHFLSAGRSSPFEMYRAKVDRPDYMTGEDAAMAVPTM